MEKDGREGTLNKDLAELIDKYRDNLSREEFVDLCVRTFLKSRENTVGPIPIRTASEQPPKVEKKSVTVEPATKQPLPQEEPQEAKKQQWPPKIVQQLTGAAAAVRPSSPKTRDAVPSSTTAAKQAKVSVSAPAGGKSQQVAATVQTPEKAAETTREFPGAKYVNEGSFIMLWLLAIGLYGLGDLVTTHWALQLGLLEANPIARLFGNILNMALFKIATIIAAFLISYCTFHSKTMIFSAPVMMVLVGTFLTVNNALLIFHIIR
jgi:hypothetical protein